MLMGSSSSCRDTYVIEIVPPKNHISKSKSLKQNEIEEWKIVLKIDDTDLERSIRESEETMLQDLSWLGVHLDEGYSLPQWCSIPFNFLKQSPHRYHALCVGLILKTQQKVHARKCFIRQLSGGKDKRRATIHDITNVNLSNLRTPSDSKITPSPDQSIVIQQQQQPNSCGIPSTYSQWNQPYNGSTISFKARQGNMFVFALSDSLIWN